MRAQHDTILVGIGTALNDNPQLNSEHVLLSYQLQTVADSLKARLLPPKEGQRAPVPIVLDSELRFRLDSKLAENFKSGKGERPIIITRKKIKDSDDPIWDLRKRTLEAAGLLVIEVPIEQGARMPEHLRSCVYPS